MPVDRSRYPANWEDIARACKERAGWQCEELVKPVEYLDIQIRCYRRHGTMDTGKRGQLYKVVLTVAHLNHDTSDNRPENLKVLCQEHHLAYDHQLHVEHAKETRKRKKEEHQERLF